MNIDEAFRSTRADDLFASVAAFGDARELEVLDVADGQRPSRQAINTAIANALRHKQNPGSRIALIKGDAGSGKSHVLTTTFKRAVSSAIGEVYPAVLQLTAPVKQGEYEIWLLDATIRQLSARHFVDDSNHSPLRRLAGQLLARVSLAEQDEYLRLIDDLDDDGEIPLALRFARRIRRDAHERLAEDPPSEAFLAVVLLAGFGDSSALNYLRHGMIDNRLRELALYELSTPHQRIDVLKNLGLAAQIVGASIALGFDQVENAVRLGSEDLFVHTLTQAVRIAESVVNCAVIVVVLGVEYENIVNGRRATLALPDSDRDRIEREGPFPASLDLGTPAFLRAVVAQRLAVLRKRAKLPQVSGSLEPLPSWFLPRLDQARSVRMALREVAMFRERAVEFGRVPTQAEHQGASAPESNERLEHATDIDKEWADFLDVAPATRNKLLDITKAELVAWWASYASREYFDAEPAEVTLRSLDDEHSTPIVEIVLMAKGVAIERRQLGLCEAPNRHQKLAHQVERFLDAASGVPAVLRTNGFPKGRRSQVAGALRKLEALSGLKLDLGETEWHILQRARDFAERMREEPSFLPWRRDRQWLLQLISSLQPLLAHPEVVTGGDMAGARALDGTVATAATDAPVGGAFPLDSTRVDRSDTEPLSPFPVHIGKSFEGMSILWDPYRDAPNSLNNFSFLVTGDAGSGKTQTIRVLIDAACRQGLALTIFDFKADYCAPEFAEPLGIEVVDVRALGLPFNPLQPPPRGASGVQPIEHAYEIAGVLTRVFGLGAVQEGILRDAITGVYKDAGIQAREWVDPSSVSWPTFDLVLDRLRDERNAASLVTKLSLFSDLGLFPANADRNSSFEQFVNKRVCLKLSDLPTDTVKSAVAEIIIIQLHGHALRGEQPRRLTRMMVFDEAHRVKDSRRLESLAREGRAFGVGIVIGTQFPGDIPETMAGNLATQLFLMNNQAAHRRFVVAQLLGTNSTSEARALLDKLGHLKPLEGLFANAHHNGVLVSVLPHHARGLRSDRGA